MFYIKMNNNNVKMSLKAEICKGPRQKWTLEGKNEQTDQYLPIFGHFLNSRVHLGLGRQQILAF